jgi:hypothetical protein
MNIATPTRTAAAPHWADTRTEAAHYLLERLANTLNPESDAASMVLQAMEAVEAADCELERGV